MTETLLGLEGTDRDKFGRTNKGKVVTKKRMGKSSTDLEDYSIVLSETGSIKEQGRVGRLKYSSNCDWWRECQT